MMAGWDDDPELHAEAERLRAHAQDREAGQAIVKTGRGYNMRKVAWLWPGWLARGKLHILGGAKGAGKSTIGFDLLAQLSRAGKFPDGTRAPLGDSLVWSGEDDI